MSKVIRLDNKKKSDFLTAQGSSRSAQRREWTWDRFWIYFCCTKTRRYIQACRALRIFRPRREFHIEIPFTRLRLPWAQLGRRRWPLLSKADGTDDDDDDDDGVGDGGARCTVFPLLPPQLSRLSDSCTGHLESPQAVGPDTTNSGRALPSDRQGRPLPDGKGARDRLLYRPTDRRDNALECTLGRPTTTVRKSTDGARANETVKWTPESPRANDGWCVISVVCARVRSVTISSRDNRLQFRAGGTYPRVSKKYFFKFLFCPTGIV